MLATQFEANDANSLKAVIDRYCSSSISSVTFDFAQWKNQYFDGRDMADEILYVLNRKQQGDMMGNLLDTPSLLMRKQFVRNTETVKETLNQG